MINNYGCTAYRAILPYQESYRELLGHTTVWLGDDHHVVAYPNGNPKYSQQWMNLVLVRRSAQQENESWVEPVAVEDMVKLFHTPSPVLNRIFEDLVQSPEPVFKWGLYLHKPLPYWSVDKISLLGDAAHSMLPFMAQGAGMAIEDAHVLAACLSRGLPIERALALYQKLRLERTTAVQRGSAEHSDIYHASGGTAAVRNSLLSAVNNVSPHLMNQRMDWIYSYDATKSVPRQDCS
ncbi:hypothetical protein SARC_10462 [Sphaeroforma arctica JP610]|uniref:FAD-binding domain-containing protein n=1 Tax=Sphaeroforma arctica JP610 TaxID=667725 RepID=A0A0L0FJY1_9EUKA|nr:hypothetical protein SARC_10462 [Sphaeroforma arctica JP610]KNC77069.1 hypothetical protein SARC_10462 [Sphaeroforma arctica JP610]|eukprot:XP_014150971.1 hypothetical protein SARC_10462 [Sphaeroforma arctica JP610]